MILVDLPHTDSPRLLPVFAEDGLSWDQAERVVTVQGVAYRVGEQVRFGGSEHARELFPGSTG